MRQVSLGFPSYGACFYRRKSFLPRSSAPVYSPHYVMFPQDETGFSIDDQFFVGNSGLLVKPITRPGVTEEAIYLPEDNVC